MARSAARPPRVTLFTPQRSAAAADGASALELAELSDVGTTSARHHNCETRTLLFASALPSSRHRALSRQEELNGDGTATAAAAAKLSDQLRQAPTWAITTNTLAFMCVPRAIPACFAQTGWALGGGALIYSSIVTYDTGCIIGELCLLYPDAGSFPDLVGVAAARFAARRGAAPSACARWRRRGRLAILGLQFSTYYLTTIAELIYFEQYAGQLWASSSLCQWQWLLLVSLASLPLLQIPTFSETRWAALIIGIVPLLFNVLVFFYEIALVRPWDCSPGPSFDGGGSLSATADDSGAPVPSPGRSLSSLLLGLNAISYAFGGHGLYPEEIREMTRPEEWPQVMRVSYGFTVPLYLVCGLLGYAAYGDYSRANINLNFPANGANFASIAVQLVQELYFVFSTNLVLHLAVELALGIDPTARWTPRWRGLPPVLVRLGTRTLLFGSQVLLAQMLLSGDGDTLLSLQALIGAAGMTAFTYFLPYMLLLVLDPRELSRWRKLVALVNIGLGIAIMLGGVSSAIDDLVRSSAGAFASNCKLDYAYSPLAPADPCHLGGMPNFDYAAGGLEATNVSAASGRRSLTSAVGGGWGGRLH